MVNKRGIFRFPPDFPVDTHGEMGLHSTNFYTFLSLSFLQVHIHTIPGL